MNKWALTTALVGLTLGSINVGYAESGTDSLLQRGTLIGDWGGLRSARGKSGGVPSAIPYKTYDEEADAAAQIKRPPSKMGDSSPTSILASVVFAPNRAAASSALENTEFHFSHSGRETRSPLHFSASFTR